MSKTPWLEITITGFVYIVALFFFLFLLSGKPDFVFPTFASEYLAVLGILTLFFSYVIGLAMHVILQRAIELVKPSYKFDAVNQVQLDLTLPETLRASLNGSYNSLIMFRHLFVATFVMTVLLLFWFWRDQFELLKLELALASFLLTIIWVFAWRIQAHFFAQIRNASQNIRALTGRSSAARSK